MSKQVPYGFPLFTSENLYIKFVMFVGSEHQPEQENEYSTAYKIEYIDVSLL